MKSRRLTQIPSMTLAVMLALAVGQALVVASKARAAGGGKLEGVWLMESTLVDCATGDSLPIPGNPFPSLHTYVRGGAALDSGASPPRLPAVTRSAAHGIWERTGAQTFRERFYSFGFDDIGDHVRTVKVTIERSLIQDKQAEPDEIIGFGTAQIFDALTGDQVGAGCVKDSGRRVAFDE